LANNNIKRFTFNFRRRTTPLNGSFQSGYFNDTVAELAVDFSNIASEWNSKLIPLCAGIPDGSKDTSIDAFTKGLDGKNFWVDRNATNTSSEPRFYFTSKGRPYTLAELFQYTWSYVDNSVSTITASTSTSTTIVSSSTVEGEPVVTGYREVTPTGSAFPTSVVWYTDSGKTEKIWEIIITYNISNLPISTITRYYTGGVITKTVTDTITYYGSTMFESSRTRVVT
jgi:hypothetical protein